MEKDEIIKLVQELSDKKGETITRREFPYSPSVYLKYFKTWSEVVETAGLKKNMLLNLSDEDVLNYIRKYEKEFGKIPQYKKFNNSNGYPDASKISERFGSWANALIKAGFDAKQKRKFRDNSQEELLKIFKEEYLRINPISGRDYNKRRSETAPGYQYLQNVTGLVWNDLLKKLGLEVKREAVLDKQKVILAVNDFVNKYSKAPSLSEFRKFLKDEKKGFDVDTIRRGRHFGTWNNFLKGLDLEITKSPSQILESKEEMIIKYKRYSEKIGAIKGATFKDLKNSDMNRNGIRLRFGGMSGLRRASGYYVGNDWTRFSKEDILKILKEKYLKNGRRLTNAEIYNDEDLPSQTTICSYFLTTKMTKVWEEVEKELNI